MKHILWLLLFLCPAATVFAQQKQLVPLVRSESIPDLHFSSLFNHTSSTMDLKQFKGKAVLLDFWATWCGSCLDGFPKMEALQAEFKDQLQIIMVNEDQRDNQQKIAAFFQKRKDRFGTSFTLPVILNDTVLKTIFPHAGIPFCVWIDSAGKYRVATYSAEATASNLRDFINGNGGNLQPIREDLFFNPKIPLLTGTNTTAPAPLTKRSILTGEMPALGFSFGTIADSTSRFTRLYAINATLAQILSMAYPKECRYPENRRVNESSISDLTEKYCYDFTIAPCAEDDFYKKVRADLGNEFAVTVVVSQRELDCYVLRVNDRYKLTVATDPPDADLDKHALKKFIHGAPLSTFTDFLGSFTKIPVINETDIKGTISIDLPFNIYSFDVPTLTRWLATKGFELQKTKRNLEVTLITDR